ncbi:hypothetical protein [Nostoc sp. DSM 114167]|jgi:hypothetical protein|uniref:hypothetical protein n=1 Tax=Nostoc sp. DSM 114167 TaxID=3439050 RepID=UPI004046838A
MPLFNQEELPELLLPINFTHWHDESTIKTGGAIRIDTNTSVAYGTEIYQDPPALNDSFSFNKNLKAGNYILSILTVGYTNLGILKLEINGVTSFSDLDLYSSSTIFNRVLEKNIFIPSDGMHEFKFTVIGKNPSSSNYYFSGRKIWARKI